MKISVTPGDVKVASVQVRRHTGGVYTFQILTPNHSRPGVSLGGGLSSTTGRFSDVNLYPSNGSLVQEYTRVRFEPESNDEEEALLEGLFDVLDAWSRYSITLIAVPASVLEESEEAGSWEPTGNVDYLT